MAQIIATAAQLETNIKTAQTAAIEKSNDCNGAQMRMTDSVSKLVKSSLKLIPGTNVLTRATREAGETAVDVSTFEGLGSLPNEADIKATLALLATRTTNINTVKAEVEKMVAEVMAEIAKNISDAAKAKEVLESHLKPKSGPAPSNPSGPAPSAPSAPKSDAPKGEAPKGDAPKK